MTPISQLPGRGNADPSVGMSSAFDVQQSSTHSQALPCMSKSPHELGLRLPTGMGPSVRVSLRQPSRQAKREPRSANLAYAQSSVSSLPKLQLVVVPARAAYSHSASVGKRYGLPVRRLPSTRRQRPERRKPITAFRAKETHRAAAELRNNLPA